MPSSSPSLCASPCPLWPPWLPHAASGEPLVPARKIPDSSHFHRTHSNREHEHGRLDLREPFLAAVSPHSDTRPRHKPRERGLSDPPAGHGAALPLEPRSLRLGQCLLLGRGSGRYPKLGSVLLRIL